MYSSPCQQFYLVFRIHDEIFTPSDERTPTHLNNKILQYRKEKYVEDIFSEMQRLLSQTNQKEHQRLDITINMKQIMKILRDKVGVLEDR